MDVLKNIREVVPDLNNEQIEAITSTERPVLVIAGPGTGKTLTMVLRTLYLLLSGKAKPEEIILTTFTEKAAFELRDRVSQLARKLGYEGQLRLLRVGTMHSLCDKFISKFLSSTPLKKNYTILDELTQNFFIYEYFDDIISPPTDGKFLGKWSSKWQTIKGIIPYLNKVTEEMIDSSSLTKSKKPFLKEIAECYLRYRDKMIEHNKVDFSHLQRIFFDLLSNNDLYPKIKSKVKYIMIDEYQDTNHIQEQIMLTLAKPDNNICVVGDEDQSLYRFRGATVRNILEFQKYFDNCKTIKLNINYRSHKSIISKYNKFMNSINWNGFRFEKQTKPNLEVEFPDYPSVFCIWGKDGVDEAERFATMIRFLKDNNVISDYSDVALLLTSIRIQNSAPYIEALNNHNIPYFAPRAKAFFENEEIKLLLACYALVFGFYGKHLDNFEKKEYLRESLLLLKDYVGSPLQDYLQRKAKQIDNLNRGSLNLTILDYFYHLLAYRPFCDFLKDENRAHNLSLFSQLISVFQDYSDISLVTARNKDYIKFYLFGSFFNFLLEGGIDEYEDPDNPIPKGYVQIMTIHQSKGLEFPLVVVGSLDKRFRVLKQVDRNLGPYSPRGTFETEKQMTKFDRMRHFYVAFSRAEKMLVLTTSKKPQPWFYPIWDGLEQWPYVRKDSLEAQKFVSRPQFTPKRSYSLSSINMYEICPLQYLFYKEYKFQPSRSAQVLFGSLVHETIEDIHRNFLENRDKKIDTLIIENWLEDNYRALVAAGLRPISKTQKETALKQVINYFNQNTDLLDRIQETEVDVSVEKENYILAGKVDLLLGKDRKLEILDFKTQPKPDLSNPIIDRYFKHLCLYAHILKERHGKLPKRLYIYWTAEEKRRDALMEFEYTKSHIDEAGRHFDEQVKGIQEKVFKIKIPPNINKVCKECDFRFYCSMNGIIKFKTKKLVEV